MHYLLRRRQANKSSSSASTKKRKTEEEVEEVAEDISSHYKQLNIELKKKKTNILAVNKLQSITLPSRKKSINEEERDGDQYMGILSSKFPFLQNEYQVIKRSRLDVFFVHCSDYYSHV